MEYTSTGMVARLREQYGVQATTAIPSGEVSTPSCIVASIAVQSATDVGDMEGARDFLREQGYERVESTGWGLHIWERQDHDEDEQ